MLANSHALFVLLATAGGVDWGIVKQYLFDTYIVQGAIITVVLAVLAQLVGSMIGLMLYLLRRARFTPLRWFAEAYIWFFRGTPLLVQLLLIFGLFPILHLLRFERQYDNFFIDLGFNNRILLESFLPAFIAFALNEGAYMSEIVRAGIDSIDVGQMEAAKSLGMNYGLAMRRIILPQAARVILPPLGNEFNSMLKTTSLAGTVGLFELYGASDSLIANTLFKPFEAGIVAMAWYLLMTTIWGFFQAGIERRLNASNLDAGAPPSFIDRLLGRGGTVESAEAAAKRVVLSEGRR